MTEAAFRQGLARPLEGPRRPPDALPCVTWARSIERAPLGINMGPERPFSLPRSRSSCRPCTCSSLCTATSQWPHRLFPPIGHKHLVGEQSNAYRILLRYDRKSRHRRIKKQRRYERLAATSQLSLWYIYPSTDVDPRSSGPMGGPSSLDSITAGTDYILGHDGPTAI